MYEDTTCLGIFMTWCLQLIRFDMKDQP